ncbi:hypothetical protein [Micromonospora sp. DT31]|uniref:hypothetical protein n=1 Tax=Micromonospora sp. DT31 TaxID=3393434 RepID=UPI003CEB4D2A
MNGPDDEEGYLIFEQPAGDGLVFSIGLDVTPRDWGISLDPSVGVIHSRVSGLAASFLGLTEGACVVGASLTDLFPAQGREGGLVPRWAVLSRGDIEAVVQLLLSDLRDVGLPFLRAFTSLTEMARHLEGVAKSQFDWGNLAILYAELGRFDQCVSVLNRMMVGADSEPSFVAEQTRQFVVRLREHYRLPA